MIVIPMAGVSRRFTEAGYDKPKYMLLAKGRSVFAHAVASFEAYFETLPFLFIVRDVADTPDFVRRECEALGVKRFQIVTLMAETRGQADTVVLGLSQANVADDEPVTIFNIDTFRPGFRFPDHAGRPVDGYLEVFRGEGANWSYVRPSAPGEDVVAETAEKRPISDLCCTGLYHFRTAGQFREAFEVGQDPGQNVELYVAPLYNVLIARGQTILYDEIPVSSVIFCGIPAEYVAFCDA